MSQTAPDGTHPDIPDKGWTNPFQPGTPMYLLFDKRVRQGRDLVIIVDDYNAGRGTGKTAASLQLGHGMDQNGGMTREKATMEPEEIRNAYTGQPVRSSLVLDEGEVGASNRQAMTKVNQALREIMSMGRVEQKYVIINTPLKEFIDKDLRKLADVWISMTKKGEGLVHFFDWQPYAGRLMTPQKQWLEFNDVPTDHELRDVYNYLTREKRKRMRGDDGSGFIPYEKHREQLEQAKRDVRKETRDEMVRNIMSHPRVEASDVTQTNIGEAIGVSQTTISNILNDD